MTGKQVNRRTQSEYFQLCKWLENNQQVITSETNKVDIAEKANKALAFNVTRANIDAAMATLGFMIPGKPKTTDQKLNIVIRELAILLNKLGGPIPTDLSDIMKEK